MTVYEGKQTTMLSIEQINDLKFETTAWPAVVDVPITACSPSTNFPEIVNILPETDVKKVSEKRKTKNRFQTCLNISMHRIFDYEPLS